MGILRVLLLASVLAAVCGQRCSENSPATRDGVTTLRKPMSPDDIERLQCDHPQCTAIYEINLDRRYSTQCNDVAMMSPHGLNQLDCIGEGVEADYWSTAGLADLRDEPFKDNAQKQNAAKATFSVTALTESSEDTSPLGFKLDRMKGYYSICVTIKNVRNAWMEVMAASVQQDRSMCVKDWNRVPTQSNVEEEACGNGEIYECREATTVVQQGNTNGIKYVGTDMGLQFYCKDSCENTDTEFFWRITQSHMTPKQDGVDAQGQPVYRSASSEDELNRDEEDWCIMRKGFDYPATLLNPYPDQYEEPAVFSSSTLGATTTRASSALLGLLALAVLVVFLLV